ncbi:MAG: S49 family peptidase, partial [Nitrospinae bacterium]|nr:S49 family peptidase [Nitrospinota bacterium]
MAIIFVAFGSFSAFLIYLFLNFAGSDIESVIKGDNQIAVIKVEGIIDSSDEVIKHINECANNKKVKGILLRINTPGGGVAPSQEIYKELVRFKNTGKKLVVSMGSLSASGGYYIAAPADKIVANPGTITGSIGVIFNFT